MHFACFPACSSPSICICFACYVMLQLYSALKFHVPYYMFNIISHYPVHCMGPAYRRLNRRESCTIFTNTNKHAECRTNSSPCTSDLNPTQATCSYSLYIGMDHKSHIQNYVCMHEKTYKLQPTDFTKLSQLAVAITIHVLSVVSC